MKGSTSTTTEPPPAVYEGRRRADDVHAVIRSAFRDSLRRNSLVPEYRGKHRAWAK
jgi:hypothetical protein